MTATYKETLTDKKHTYELTTTIGDISFGNKVEFDLDIIPVYDKEKAVSDLVTYFCERLLIEVKRQPNGKEA